MGESIKNIAIIGDGIAAWAMQYALKGRDDFHITQFFQEDFAPSCSLRTTSINCLRGTQKGLSKLGDLIFDSYEEFVRLHEQENFEGVYKGIEYQIWNTQNKDKWERRYSEFFDLKENLFLQKLIKEQDYYVANEAYFIDPTKLKNSLLKGSNTNIVNDIVIDISREKLVKTRHKTYEFDYIINCSSYVGRNLLSELNTDYDYYINHTKPVAGTYLEIPLNKLDFSFEENFNLVLNGHHFIYKKNQGILQIGSTSENNNSIQVPRDDLIKEIYLLLQEELFINLPAFEDFKKITGIRHKGHKRIPFWGEVAIGIYSITGLYKNAFTFAFLAAKDIKQELIEL